MTQGVPLWLVLVLLSSLFAHLVELGAIFFLVRRLSLAEGEGQAFRSVLGLQGAPPQT